MMSPEDYARIRPGDTVRVSFLAEVESTSGRVTVLLEDGESIWVHQDEIVEHIPQPRDVEVGHIVLRQGCPIEFTVKGLFDDEAWIHHSSVFDRIVKIDQLTFVREA